MIRFLLNNELIRTDKPPGMLLLDFIRYHASLKGTKIGCREGDCGACTVLIGELKAGRVAYWSAVSCLTALGNVQGKQVVTVEGTNMEEGLNGAQRVLCEESGTQCGFCTPGFIVSMAGFCLSDKSPTYANALAAVDGNICRCTGYKSIERALAKLTGLLEGKGAGSGVDFLMEHKLLPPFFKTVKTRLELLAQETNGIQEEKRGAVFLGGGTDLYVQRHEEMVESALQFLSGRPDLKGIYQEGRDCCVGAASTVTDLLESPLFRKGFPAFDQYARLISSTPIRNIATVGGNLVNASPIGDLSIFFLAVDARVVLSDGGSLRELPLREFYLGYKKLHKKPEEWIAQVRFTLPETYDYFHFEKVSKRTCLDIASVNSAIGIRMKGDCIESAHLSAGGVGPVPAYLSAAAMLRGERVTEFLVLELVRAASAEVRPISDARGTEAYKRLLLGQLIKAHFLTLFPDRLDAGALLKGS